MRLSWLSLSGRDAASYYALLARLAASAVLVGTGRRPSARSGQPSVAPPAPPTGHLGPTVWRRSLPLAPDRPCFVPFARLLSSHNRTTTAAGRQWPTLWYYAANSS